MPVPELVSSDISNKKIVMVNNGKNLKELLINLENHDKDIEFGIAAISEAFRITAEVAELGIWHFDIAARNFLVSGSIDKFPPKILLVDFTLAISENLPLQKPLWIRPSKSIHHTDLIIAIKKDWERFFTETKIQLPTDWEMEFDVPITTYENYWGESFACDKIERKWCVIAHSLGCLLNEFKESRIFSNQKIKDILSESSCLLNIDIDSDAKNRIFHIHRDITRKLNKTPMPKAIFQIGKTVNELKGLQVSVDEPKKATKNNHWPVLIDSHNRSRTFWIAVAILIGYYNFEKAYQDHRLMPDLSFITIVFGSLISSCLIVYGVVKKDLEGSIRKLGLVQGCCLVVLALDLYFSSFLVYGPATLIFPGLAILALSYKVTS
jgi:hypothetical protein